MNHKRENSDDYIAIFLNDTPLMDVRAPVEFEKGSFPQAVNIPLLDDIQREQVGTCYKKSGPDAAMALGYKLATDEMRQQRLAGWQSFIRQHPRGYMFCFRGGQRSHLTQEWLAESGYDYPLVKGGYKAMRRFLLDALDESIETMPLIVLWGQNRHRKNPVDPQNQRQH